MLTELFKANADSVEAGLVRVTDRGIDHGAARRVTVYWYAQAPGHYGPNGFTADWRTGRAEWLVRAVSGIAVEGLVLGAPVTEWQLVDIAKKIFETALSEREHDPDYKLAKARHEALTPGGSCAT